jgi:OHCU decarboxylase
MCKAALMKDTQEQSVNLNRFNVIPFAEAEKELLNCCGSREWASRLAKERPFTSTAELIESADRIWFSLQPDNWLEAFRSHPKIGEKKTQQATSAESAKWSEQEQSGIQGASQATTRLLTQLNDEYEKKFGFIFIVCATGKSPEEMLALLRARVNNSPDRELLTAAREQAKISQLRITKLLNQ